MGIKIPLRIYTCLVTLEGVQIKGLARRCMPPRDNIWEVKLDIADVPKHIKLPIIEEERHQQLKRRAEAHAIDVEYWIEPISSLSYLVTDGDASLQILKVWEGE